MLIYKEGKLNCLEVDNGKSRQNLYLQGCRLFLLFWHGRDRRGDGRGQSQR